MTFEMAKSKFITLRGQDYWRAKSEAPKPKRVRRRRKATAIKPKKD